jgi:hypothetical protein
LVLLPYMTQSLVGPGMDVRPKLLFLLLLVLLLLLLLLFLLLLV